MYQTTIAYAQGQKEAGAIAMPCLLAYLARQMRARDLQSLVDGALAYYTRHQQVSLDSAGLGEQLAQTLSQEQEGAFAPVRDFLEVVQRVGGASMPTRLTTIAQAYLERTQYLLPFLHCFGEMSIRVLRSSGRTQLVNFLRDGLVFWPSQDALLGQDPGCRLAFVLYSRAHAAQHLPVRLFQRTETGAFVEGAADLAQSLLVDVGLYGTLLSRMLEQHLCQHSVGVLFFASRSPFITGWFNLLTCAALIASDLQVDLLDTIRLADTVESLLKPVALVPDQLVSTLTDPVSFVCSTAFLWAQRGFSLYQQRQGPIQPRELHLEAVKASRTAWFINKPVPRWEGAEAFINGWHHGPLYPMDQLCGLSL